MHIFYFVDERITNFANVIRIRWNLILSFFSSIVENLEHCDFIALRDMMIKTHLQDLKDVTNNILYENYRCRKLGGLETNKQQRVLNKWVKLCKFFLLLRTCIRIWLSNFCNRNFLLRFSVVLFFSLLFSSFLLNGARFSVTRLCSIWECEILQSEYAQWDQTFVLDAETCSK